MATLPAEMLTRHIAILGSTGSGKTSVAKAGLVEPALEAGSRICIVDPTGAWWGLRLRADGKPGFKVYIFGGDHADFPLSAKNAEVLAEAFGTASDSAIFDTSLMTVTERTEFFTKFANAILRKNRGPLHLVIDESHLFMPQSGSKSGGQVPAMLHAGNNLVSLGRSRGLRITMISQRPAKLHKDSLTQAQSLIAMRVLAPQDRKAIAEWIAEQADEAKGREIVASLSGLKAGEAWVWAPLQGLLKRMAFPMPRTFDSSRAPDERDGAGPELKPLDLGELKDRLATVEADAKANDPKVLKGEVDRLRRELLASSKGLDQTAVDTAYKNGYATGNQHGHSKGFAAAMRAVAGAIATIPYQHEESDAPAGPPPSVKRPEPRAAVPQVSGPGEDMPGPHRKLLTVLAQYPDGRTKKQLAVLAGYAHNGGAFNNPLANLRARGWASGGPDCIRATPQGLAALGSFDPLPTGAALREHWFASPALGGPGAKLLRALCDAYPDSMSKAELASACGYEANGGAFNNPLSRLRNLELVTGYGGAPLRASDDLF